MHLKDAKPGQRLRDKDGDEWERHESGATVHFVGPKSDRGAAPLFRDEWDLREVDRDFGPFTPVEP